MKNLMQVSYVLLKIVLSCCLYTHIIIIIIIIVFACTGSQQLCKIMIATKFHFFQCLFSVISTQIEQH